MSSQVKLSCPHCRAVLTIDLEAGVIVSHEEPPKKDAKIDFDARLAQIRSEKDRAEGKMAEALRKEKDRQRLMEDRFAELMKTAGDTDGEPPVRDIDLD